MPLVNVLWRVILPPGDSAAGTKREGAIIYAGDKKPWQRHGGRWAGQGGYGCSDGRSPWAFVGPLGVLVWVIGVSRSLPEFPAGSYSSGSRQYRTAVPVSGSVSRYSQSRMFRACCGKSGTCPASASAIMVWRSGWSSTIRGSRSLPKWTIWKVDGRYDAGVPVNVGGLRLGEDGSETRFLDSADCCLQSGWHSYGDAAAGVALARLDEDGDVSLLLAGEFLPVFPCEPGFLLAGLRELVFQEVDVVDVAGHLLLRFGLAVRPAV